MDTSATISFSGHGGRVGAAAVRALRQGRYSNLLVGLDAGLDLNDLNAVFEGIACNQSHALCNRATAVGGINRAIGLNSQRVVLACQAEQVPWEYGT